MFQVQPLSQRDPRWKGNILGTDNTTTISSYGCLLTCLTMAADAFGANDTPATLNEKMKTVGGFQGAMIIPAVLPGVVANLRYNGFQPCPNPPAPVSAIDAALAADQPVIVKVGATDQWLQVKDIEGDQGFVAAWYISQRSAPGPP